jgi:hypothetical protein
MNAHWQSFLPTLKNSKKIWEGAKKGGKAKAEKYKAKEAKKDTKKKANSKNKPVNTVETKLSNTIFYLFAEFFKC